jgi:anti-sigma factor RsiW
MNCERFQNRLYEYLEGTLSAGTRAAADQHLAQCTACRKAVRQEEQIAQVLSARLRLVADAHTLHPHVRRRILSTFEVTPLTNAESIACLWNRFAKPLGIAVPLLLIVTFLLINFFSGPKLHEKKAARGVGSAVRSAVSVDLSYRVPTYKFRKEGNLVVDTLSYETVAASGTLWMGGPTPVREQ